MAQCEVLVETLDATGTRAPLRDAWVYLRAQGESVLNPLVLRTDRDGQLRSLKPGGDENNPWDFGGPYRGEYGSTIGIYYSQGARPIPPAALARRVPSLFKRKLESRDWPHALEGTPEALLAPLEITAVAPGGLNALSLPETTVVTLPLLRAALVSPEELHLWPLLFEAPTEVDRDVQDPPEDYATAGLWQGAALFGDYSLHARENERAHVVPDDHRPRERGLRVQCRVDRRARGVTVEVLDSTGAYVPLREKIEFDALPASFVTAKSDATVSDGAGAGYVADLFFRYTTTAPRVSTAGKYFGLVHLLVCADTPDTETEGGGAAVPTVEAFTLLLCGAQITLVEDSATATGAAGRGVPRGEADEKVIVDFRRSPEPTHAALSAQGRQRRMVTHDIGCQPRPFDPTMPESTTNPLVPRPQMPCFMADLALVGASDKRLAELMKRYWYRHSRGLPAPPAKPLKLEIDWEMTLSWNGPDAHTGIAPIRRDQKHAYVLPVKASQAVTLYFGLDGAFVNAAGVKLALDTNGGVPDAFAKAPRRIPFPVPDRRLPVVSAQGRSRPWGRHAGAAALPSLVVEFQPLIADAQGAELIRGGDGQLEVTRATLDGKPLDSWSTPLAPAEQPAPPLLRLPRFRVRGTTPADVTDLINALVKEHYAIARGSNGVGWLHVDCWTTTLQLIFLHENDGRGQFETRGPNKDTNARREPFSHKGRVAHFGHERDMPIFGPPHGFGYGQLDFIFKRGPTDDEVWSFVENIRAAVKLAMEEKAEKTFALFAGVSAANVTQLERAVYQRNIVRQYNSGADEFRRVGSHYVLSPPDNDKLQYPNNVLTGQQIDYSFVTNPSLKPPAFTSRYYGPDTEREPGT